MNNLALTLRAQGDLDAARRLHEQALAAYRQVLGDQHTTTLTTERMLAKILTQFGDASASASES